MDNESLGGGSAGLPYFAYGSNMDPDQMLSRCPGAERAGNAELSGSRFAIVGTGVATIFPEPDSTVTGVLWAITDRHLETLDRYEGVAQGAYSRCVVTVRSMDGDVQAWAYVASSVTETDPRAGYLETVCRGARSSGISEDYIATLGGGR